MQALKNFRYTAPGIVAFIGLVPWVYLEVLKSVSLPLVKDLIYPLATCVFSFLYISLNGRKSLWNEEMERTVNKQIKDRMMAMIESRLVMTSAQKSYIRDRIFNEVAGLFWMAISGDPVAAMQKEKFYQNGRWYSLCFDVFIIYTIMGYAYVGLAGYHGEVLYLYTGLFLLIVTLLAWYVFIPKRREEHLRLSSLQLDDVEDRLLDSTIMPQVKAVLSRSACR